MEFEKLQTIIADTLHIDKEQITMESSFVNDLEADSLDIVEIMMGIEDEFDVKIEDEDLEKIVTVEDVVEQIKNTKN